MKGWAWSWYGAVKRKTSIGIGGIYFAVPKQCILKILAIYSERQLGIRDFTYTVKQYLAASSTLTLKYVEAQETNTFYFPNDDYIGDFGLLPHDNILVFHGDQFVIEAGNMDIEGQIKVEIRGILSTCDLPTTSTPYGAANLITEVSSKTMGFLE